MQSFGGEGGVRGGASWEEVGQGAEGGFDLGDARGVLADEGFVGV